METPATATHVLSITGNTSGLSNAIARAKKEIMSLERELSKLKELDVNVDVKFDIPNNYRKQIERLFSDLSVGVSAKPGARLQQDIKDIKKKIQEIGDTDINVNIKTNVNKIKRQIEDKLRDIDIDSSAPKKGKVGTGIRIEDKKIKDSLASLGQKIKKLESNIRASSDNLLNIHKEYSKSFDSVIKSQEKVLELIKRQVEEQKKLVDLQKGPATSPKAPKQSTGGRVGGGVGDGGESGGINVAELIRENQIHKLYDSLETLNIQIGQVGEKAERLPDPIEKLGKEFHELTHREMPAAFAVMSQAQREFKALEKFEIHFLKRGSLESGFRQEIRKIQDYLDRFGDQARVIIHQGLGVPFENLNTHINTLSDDALQKFLQRLRAVRSELKSLDEDPRLRFLKREDLLKNLSETRIRLEEIINRLGTRGKDIVNPFKQIADYTKMSDQNLRSLLAFARSQEKRAIAYDTTTSVGFGQAFLEGVGRGFYAENYAHKLGKITSWMSAVWGLYGAINVLRQTVGVISEVEQGIIDLQKVMNDSRADFDQMRDIALDLAHSYGQLAGNVLEAMGIFARQGMVQSEVLKLTETTLLANNIAEMSIDQAATLLTSTILQFNKEASDSMAILDSWNEVANQNAVTALDLGEAVARTGSMANQLGIDFHELNGITATLSASLGRSGAEIGNSLKFILSRGFQPTTIRQLEDLGIAVRKNATEMRDFWYILQDAAQVYQSLSSQDQHRLAFALGGSRHANVIIALFENWDRVITATNQSINSVGSALRENEKYMQSYAKRVAQLQASLQSIAITLGDAGLLSVLKSGVSMIDFFLSGFNKLPGAIKETTMHIIALTAAIKTLDLVMKRMGSRGISDLASSVLGRGGAVQAKATQQAIKGVASSIGETVTMAGLLGRARGAFASLTQVVRGLISTVGTLFARFAPLIGKVGALIGLISAGVAIYRHFTKSVDDIVKSQEDKLAVLNEQQNVLSENLRNITSLREEIDRLNESSMEDVELQEARLKLLEKANRLYPGIASNIEDLERALDQRQRFIELRLGFTAEDIGFQQDKIVGLIAYQILELQKDLSDTRNEIARRMEKATLEMERFGRARAERPSFQRELEELEKLEGQAQETAHRIEQLKRELTRYFYAAEYRRLGETQEGIIPGATFSELDDFIKRVHEFYSELDTMELDILSFDVENIEETIRLMDEYVQKAETFWTNQGRELGRYADAVSHLRDVERDLLEQRRQIVLGYLSGESLLGGDTVTRSTTQWYVVLEEGVKAVQELRSQHQKMRETVRNAYASGLISVGDYIREIDRLDQLDPFGRQLQRIEEMNEALRTGTRNAIKDGFKDLFSGELDESVWERLRSRMRSVRQDIIAEQLTSIVMDNDYARRRLATEQLAISTIFGTPEPEKGVPEIDLDILSVVSEAVNEKLIDIDSVLEELAKPPDRWADLMESLDYWFDRFMDSFDSIATRIGAAAYLIYEGAKRFFDKDDDNDGSGGSTTLQSPVQVTQLTFPGLEEVNVPQSAIVWNPNNRIVLNPPSPSPELFEWTVPPLVAPDPSAHISWTPTTLEFPSPEGKIEWGTLTIEQQLVPNPTVSWSGEVVIPTPSLPLVQFAEDVITLSVGSHPQVVFAQDRVVLNVPDELPRVVFDRDEVNINVPVAQEAISWTGRVALDASTIPNSLTEDIPVNWVNSLGLDASTIISYPTVEWSGEYQLPVSLIPAPSVEWSGGLNIGEITFEEVNLSNLPIAISDLVSVASSLVSLQSGLSVGVSGLVPVSSDQVVIDSLGVNISGAVSIDPEKVVIPSLSFAEVQLPQLDLSPLQASIHSVQTNIDAMSSILNTLTVDGLQESSSLIIGAVTSLGELNQAVSSTVSEIIAELSSPSPAVVAGVGATSAGLLAQHLSRVYSSSGMAPAFATASGQLARFGGAQAGHTLGSNVLRITASGLASQTGRVVGSGSGSTAIARTAGAQAGRQVGSNVLRLGGRSLGVVGLLWSAGDLIKAIRDSDVASRARLEGTYFNPKERTEDPESLVGFVKEFQHRMEDLNESLPSYLSVFPDQYSQITSLDRLVFSRSLDWLEQNIDFDAGRDTEDGQLADLVSKLFDHFYDEISQGIRYNLNNLDVEFGTDLYYELDEIIHSLEEARGVNQEHVALKDARALALALASVVAHREFDPDSYSEIYDESLDVALRHDKIIRDQLINQARQEIREFAINEIMPSMETSLIQGLISAFAYDPHEDFVARFQEDIEAATKQALLDALLSETMMMINLDSLKESISDVLRIRDENELESALEKLREEAALVAENFEALNADILPIIKTVFASVTSKGFATGGYTGSGPRSQVAGLVHKNEFVVPKWQVLRYPEIISALETVRKSGGSKSLYDVLVNVLPRSVLERVGYASGGYARTDLERELRELLLRVQQDLYAVSMGSGGVADTFESFERQIQRRVGLDDARLILRAIWGYPDQVVRDLSGSIERGRSTSWLKPLMQGALGSLAALGMPTIRKILAPVGNMLERLTGFKIFDFTDAIYRWFGNIFSSISGWIGNFSLSRIWASIRGAIGFSSGGFTGVGGTLDPAGIVHKNEYVVPKWMVVQYPEIVSGLERIRTRRYNAGGFVGSSRGVFVDNAVGMRTAIDAARIAEIEGIDTSEIVASHLRVESISGLEDVLLGVYSYDPSMITAKLRETEERGYLSRIWSDIDRIMYLIGELGAERGLDIILDTLVPAYEGTARDVLDYLYKTMPNLRYVTPEGVVSMLLPILQTPGAIPNADEMFDVFSYHIDKLVPYFDQLSKELRQFGMYFNTKEFREDIKSTVDMLKDTDILQSMLSAYAYGVFADHGDPYAAILQALGAGWEGTAIGRDIHHQLSKQFTFLADKSLAEITDSLAMLVAGFRRQAADDWAWDSIIGGAASLLFSPAIGGIVGAIVNMFRPRRQEDPPEPEQRQLVRWQKQIVTPDFFSLPESYYFRDWGSSAQTPTTVSHDNSLNVDRIVINVQNGNADEIQREVERALANVQRNLSSDFRRNQRRVPIVSV